MNAFDDLLSSSGRWEGSNRLRIGNGEAIAQSPSQIVVTPMLRDTFVRIDQTWTWKGELHVGALLVGYDHKMEAATIHWIDTFHNGSKVMACIGTFDVEGKLITHGTYASPQGTDWGWRIEIPRVIESRLRIDMYNVDPSGKDDGGVWAEFIQPAGMIHQAAQGK